MTEDEAKTKWCPFARAPMIDLSVNRDGLGAPYETSLCIGSACMAWRWYRNAASDPDLPRQFPDVPQGELNKRDDCGYCGMAGKP